MSSANGKKSLALAVAGVLGSMAASANAAPYLTVSLLGRVGNAGPFTNSVVVAPGDIVQYQVQLLLGAEGAINANAGTTPTANTTTITNWVPSNGSTNPTSGITQVRFNISQDATGIQADFDAPSTPDDAWDNGLGVNAGVVAPRGNGNDDLTTVILARATGDFAGIAGDGNPAPFIVTGGSFDIASGGTPSVLLPNITGLPGSSAIASFRFRNAANTSSINYVGNATQQNASTAANPADPVVVYQGLNLSQVPEPTSLGLLGLGAVGLMARRRRQA